MRLHGEECDSKANRGAERRKGEYVGREKKAWKRTVLLHFHGFSAYYLFASLVFQKDDRLLQ